MKTQNLLTTLGLCAGALMAPAYSQNFAPSPGSVTARDLGSGAAGAIKEEFTGFTGANSGSLPSGFYTEFGVTPSWRGYGNGDQGGSSAAGFWSYGSDKTGADTERSFGIFETGGSGDGRLYLKFRNNTGGDVKRILASYNLERWRDGARRNSIRLKYNTSPDSGYSSQPDLIETVAPANTSVDSAMNGDDTANIVSGSAIVVLPSTLTNLSTGYFRWQFSTFSGSGTRDGLGIDNIQIEALPNGTDLAWMGGSGNWGDSNWGSSSMWSDLDRNAVFGGTAGTITVNTTPLAIDLDFNTTGYALTASGSNAVRVQGVIDVASGLTATITSALNNDPANSNRLIKFGAGELVLAGTNPFDDGLSVIGGSVKLNSATAINAANRVEVSTGATFALNNNSVTVNGVIGSGSVTLGNGTLTLDVEGGNAAFRGTISGTGGIIKTGSSRQTFQTAAKTYTGATTVREGVLEITENGIPTGTSSITVNNLDGQGELSLVTDENTLQAFSMPTITLSNGYLSAESPGGVNLTSNVVMSGTENRIYASGSANQFTISGVISGSSDWRKQGAGTLFLAGANTFTGQLNVNNGTVEVTSGGTFPAGAILFFGDEDTEGREFALNKNVTVAELRGNALLPSPNPTNLTAADFALLNIKNHTFTVNQAFDSDIDGEIKPSHQGDIQGSGIFRKTGLGTTRLTRHPKTFTGKVEINEGVLQMSADGQITAGTTDIEVNQGGQLRLSGGSASAIGGSPVAGVTPGYYAFGTRTIKLSSTQRAEAISPAQPRLGFGWGALGGIRFEPPQDTEPFVKLASNVQIVGASDIHVAGTNAVATITGTLSGSAALNRTGGGTLILEADNSGFSGNVTLTNGTTVISEPAGLGDNVFGNGTGSFTVNAGAKLASAGEATIDVTSLAVSAAGILVYNGSEPLTVFTGGAALATGAVVDMSAVGSTGTYTVLVTDGAITPSTPSLTITHPTLTGTAAVVGNELRITLN